MGMMKKILLALFVLLLGFSYAPSYVSGQEALPDAPELPALPDIPQAEETTDEAPEGGKDLTVRSQEGRQEMLQGLFRALKASPDVEDANLVAEEVWAVFLQSGSASVDFLLMRGIAAQSSGDIKLARLMYDHVTNLQPEFAEGWSRSGRLAIEEDDLSRAVADTTQSLILEPRHFYALWTLGNILERLGKQDDAFEAYAEAQKVYPLHPEIKARVEFLEEGVRGKAL